jgi:stage II sporulation protein D
MKWLKYMSDSFGVSMQDADLNKFALSFKQPIRVQFVEFQGKKKRLRYFREFFSLRSTWFSVENNGGDNITLTGRGYGHGIGMSQEGGLRMANFGYSADEILTFYYPKSKPIKF